VIKGYENYFISEKGDIYSNRPNNGVQIRKQTIDPSGYCRIRLTKNGETLRVHREVLKAFDRQPRYVYLDNKTIQIELCRHLDGNPRNNKLTNLKWGTPKENSADQIIHGRNLTNKGNQKYPDHVIKEIREWSTEGASNKDIRVMYGISKAHVSYILNNKTRKGV